MSTIANFAGGGALSEHELIIHPRDSNGKIRASEPIPSAAEGIITPTNLFYILNHYDAPPPIQKETLSLRIEGAVRKPYTLSYADLRKLPSRSVMALIECAGTSRKFLKPQTPGTQLGNGSVSCGEWTGVSLATLVSKAEPIDDAVEVLIEGRDSGTAQPENVRSTFAKSLPWEKFVSPDTMIAWALNGEPLEHAHGAPIRLVVPGWYGVWWVKWISQIQVLKTRFEGFWQKLRYVYSWQDGRHEFLVTTQKVNSLITDPLPDKPIESGRQMLRGYAWSGSGTIVRVEVSFDGGSSWRVASLLEPRNRWTWTRWEIEWSAQPGEYYIHCRATDEIGHTQPPEFEWNRLGYGNNGIQHFKFLVR